MDFVFPKDQHVPAIIEQNSLLFRRSAAALDAVLSKTEYLIEDRFTVTDIIMGYTLNFGDEQGLVREFPNLMAYLQRLYQREHCTLVRHSNRFEGMAKRAAQHFFDANDTNASVDARRRPPHRRGEGDP